MVYYRYPCFVRNMLIGCLLCNTAVNGRCVTCYLLSFLIYRGFNLFIGSNGERATRANPPAQRRVARQYEYGVVDLE